MPSLGNPILAQRTRKDGAPTGQKPTTKKPNGQSPRAKNPTAKNRADDLLCLQSFDVPGEVRDALLYFTLVAATYIPEQRSPDWHFFGTVRGRRGFAADGRFDLQRRIFSSVVLSQAGKVGGRDFQSAGGGASAFAVGAVANGTIGGIHFLARYG